MLKGLKDVRRRMTQTILAQVGASETTVDENYNAHCAHFDTMIADMNECGAALHSYLMKQKAMFADGEELAKSLGRIFDDNLRMTDWPDVNCEMKQCHVADNYKAKMDLLQNVIRSSASTVCSEQGLDPLRACIARVVPELQALRSERETKLTDYDSYRRRLKEKETKKEQMEASGKFDTPAGVELQAEIDKFQKKVQSGLEEYTYVNQKAKSEIVEAKKQHDHLMDQLMITTIVCQAELFANAAAQLEAIIDTIPEDLVRDARAKIHEYVRQGGVKPAAPQEKSKLMKGLDVFTGKALPSDFSKPKESTEATPVARPVSNAPSAPPAPATAFAAKSNPFATGDPFSGDDDAAPSGGNPFGGSAGAAGAGARPPAPPAASAPPAAAVRGANMVEALFDHEAEEEDELNFSAGDLVEVIDRPDGGWWRGRCHGKEGLFPSNYVKS